MRSEPVQFESVCSRDVEMVVLEELSVSSAFRSWLLEALDLSVESATIGRAWYSAIDGEPVNSDRARERTDVEFGLEVDGGQVLIVLATRIDAAAQPLGSDEERERYRTRRERALATEWDDCRTVLIAPAAVSTGSNAETPPVVDTTVSLESIQEWFISRETDRGDYRAALVGAALEHGQDESGRQNVTGEGQRASERQWLSPVVEQYRSAVRDHEPGFKLDIDPDPDLEQSVDATDGASTVIELDGPSLAADYRLVHEVQRGTIELRIPGAAAHIESFAARYASVLSTETTLLTSGDALVLRRSVPAIESGGASDDDTDDSGSKTDSTSGSDDSQEQHADAIEAALESIRDLLETADRIQDRTR